MSTQELAQTFGGFAGVGLLSINSVAAATASEVFSNLEKAFSFYHLLLHKIVNS